MHSQGIVYGASSKVNGVLSLNFAGSVGFFVGGPYPQKPAGIYGIKMAPEVSGKCDILIPTKDFGIPSVADVRIALLKMMPEVYAGRPIYVGCMGGIGRTGTFLAIATKLAFAVSKKKCPDPVQYIRQYYLGHAVETEAQKKFIADFKVRDLAEYYRTYRRILLDKR